MIPVTPAAVSLFGASLGPAAPAGPPMADLSQAALIQNGQAQMGSLLGIDGASTTTPAPFSDLLAEAVGQVDKLGSKAKSEVEGLMSGTGVDVHEAMIATQKAAMGFELVLAVRNKALAAYQQVMGMQF